MKNGSQINCAIKKNPMSELFLYRQIWGERSHVSFVSGKPIKNFSPAHFAHVLPKGKWPRMKYSKENIVLLTYEEHYLYDFGTQHQRAMYAKRTGADWKKLDDLKDSLRAKYRTL